MHRRLQKLERKGGHHVPIVISYKDGESLEEAAMKKGIDPAEIEQHPERFLIIKRCFVEPGDRRPAMNNEAVESDGTRSFTLDIACHDFMK